MEPLLNYWLKALDSLSYYLFAYMRFLTLLAKQQFSPLLFGGMLPGNKDSSLNRFRQECSDYYDLHNKIVRVELRAVVSVDKSLK